ncbi:MAG: hypothetical protein UX80_C0006G0005 [Candidatus Amesbacteria bacterium GW2011_GWA2_47_11b]|uniref:Antitoxin n=3 Tax=Candidatus Amesiibacteriota TaxID=1752730 RepID=A0A0G1VDH7_9BACT|nr:MAG: hypothetical protein UX42_C0003G0002 [Microgenomates group bacterium GW2011_GWC1_46_20]KKU58035.1 MAG: hypothetical protein UX80_C0006G0005 [Candidatus Amesbacteria bacterium GW2011_GWA2_47_11b]KKU68075.1 MAG: hypothetical protein UX92_C0024G0010 [Candidatus Amesbacteria bacterium GW2011_GWA1_47_20]KKU84848.1 MAG: hypothetical protein UY11_C0002G0003 [Candidatus Amesbacteria bacterium GW2011_GWC2_47_8]HBC45397.1 hypothetical protein [Candidatus Collierbacteria bacterium]HCH59329.1 hypo
MTQTVSISDFRNDLSYYIGLASHGDTIIIKDSKKGEEIVQITRTQRWDPVAYKAMLKRVAGTFTARNHPEWATRAKVEKWLRQSRMADERKFDVYPG